MRTHLLPRLSLSFNPSKPSLRHLSTKTLRSTPQFLTKLPTPLLQPASHLRHFGNCTPTTRTFTTTSKMSHHADDNCIFCKIIAGKIPSFKIAETEKTYAFLDIQPLSKGHALLIPKHHGKTLLDIPDEYLADLLPLAKKVAKAVTEEEGVGREFNILQNNGPLAHQVVGHVHFHVIPKPSEEEGLGIRWPAKDANMDELKEFFGKVSARV